MTEADKQTLNAAEYTVVKVLQKMAIEFSEDTSEQVAFFHHELLTAVSDIVGRARIVVTDWAIDEIDLFDENEEVECARCGKTLKPDEIGEHDIEHDESGPPDPPTAGAGFHGYEDEDDGAK